ncbi:MAG: imelysin family protein [Litoreibacter sp.]
MKNLFAAFLMSAPTVLAADINSVIDQHILPGYAAFAREANALALDANDCQHDLKPAFNKAFDAWLMISHIQFGPIEDQGTGLAIAFWPDPKDNTGKALGRLISEQDAAITDFDAFAEVSVAAQGLFALERLLYDMPDQSDYICGLTQAITKQFAHTASALSEAWATEHAEILRTPNAENNVYKSPVEAKRVLYTALSSGLEFVQDKRLGRPLGTYSRSRPIRAEARRSGRSLHNIELSLLALHDLATRLADHDIPKTDAAFARAIRRARELEDPDLQGTATPIGRLRVEVLQQNVGSIRQTIIDEIGAALGVRAGFNSLDGD